MNADKRRFIEKSVQRCDAKSVESHDSFRIFQKLSVSICVYLWTIFFAISITAQTLAPNTPGKDAQWATAGKQAVGTSASLNSKVWFTLAQGVMTEVYYPDLTTANVHLLQFVVVNPKTKKVETEQVDAIHNVKVTRPDSLSFQQINTAKSGEWTITKTYTTDVDRDSILIDVKFETKNQNLNLYLYYDPSLGNSGMGDKAYSPLLQLVGTYEYEKGTIMKKGVKSVKKTGSATVSSGIGSEEGDKYASAVFVTSDLEELNNGYLGVNDGTEQLRKFGKIKETFAKAEKGNVVQMARIMKPKRFTTILGFSEDILKASVNVSESLEKGFSKCQAEYQTEWSDYVKTLPNVEPKYQAQFNMAAMILKAFEDKTNRGANIASASIPWGGAANANEVGSSGYHAVWARDLYQVATAFMALGDKDAANRALDFLLRVQQKPDGSIPQNSWLDGKPIGGSIQMDQVAFPLILAHELGRFDKETYEKHIKSAANYLVKNGPVTPQERWEEKGGYSPSTIAAEIAGLVCAAEIAKKNGDTESATRWLKTADEWQENVEKWTVTTNGKHSKSPYYVRITQNGKPDAGEKYEINGVYGMVDERDIVDAGFLELVRLGIKSPNDKIIQNSIKVVDEVIKVKTPNGEGFYRYNFDSYGEPDNGQRWNFDVKYTGKGRLWALLSGERGQYELALKSQVPSPTSKVGNPQSQIPNPKLRLDSMLGFANEGLMIPEQVWDSPNIPKNIDKQFVPDLKFGEGTGSATPLAWSMAQFIRLAVNLQEGRNLDTPKVVYDRYVLGKKSEAGIQTSVGKLGECEKAKTYLFDDSKIIQTIPQRTEKHPTIFSSKGENETTMRFAYFGLEKDIEIVGDFTGWKPCGLKFIKIKALPNINLLTLKFPNSARIEYKLIADGKWITDPLNPNKVDNGVGGENSFFTMPDYKATTWDSGESTPLDTIEIDSKIYGKKTIQVYVPTGGNATVKERVNLTDDTLPNGRVSALYIQDGSDYQNRAKAVQIQQNLVKANKLKPFIMVFLNPKDRMKEYWANDDYAKFLAEEVVPMIDSRYNTIKNRDGRAVLGASLGGITAVNVGLKYPQVFSRIGGQSVSWWVDDERIVKQLDKFDRKFTFYFDDGRFEGVEDSRKAVEILKGKGFDVTYVEGEAGHNWRAWRDRLADAFIAIWK